MKILRSILLWLAGVGLVYAGVRYSGGWSNVFRIWEKQILTSIAALLAMGLLYLIFSWIKSSFWRGIAVLVTALFVTLAHQLYLGNGSISTVYAAMWVREASISVLMTAVFFATNWLLNKLGPRIDVNDNE